MSLSKTELKKICEYIHIINDNEPLNSDDIEDITNSLKIFNGESIR